MRSDVSLVVSSVKEDSGRRSKGSNSVNTYLSNLDALLRINPAGSLISSVND